MSFDRGFIKWQPFESVISSKSVMASLEKKKITKPILFNEELEHLNEQIIEAYYSQNEILLTFYEQNEIHKIKTKISKIETASNTISLNNQKKITFSQILHIEN